MSRIKKREGKREGKTPDQSDLFILLVLRSSMRSSQPTVVFLEFQKFVAMWIHGEAFGGPAKPDKTTLGNIKSHRQ